jgi:outer membrane protein TolC
MSSCVGAPFIRLAHPGEFHEDDNGTGTLQPGEMTVRAFALAAIAVILSLLPATALPAPLTLLDGLGMVTEENRIVRIKQEEERISHADTVIARSKLLPSVNASYGQTFLENQPGLRAFGLVAQTGERSFYTYQLVIQQILYDFGGVTSLYQSAKLMEDTTRLDTVKTKNDVALVFSTLYFDVLESEKMIAVAEREIESLASHAQVARDLLQSGLITRNDLLQAEVRLADARQKLLNARNMRRINGARVDSMLTRPLASPVEVIEVTRPYAGLPPYEGAAETAEKDRPELKIVDATLAALRYEETARRSEYFPKLLLQGERDYTKNKYLTYEGNMGVSLLVNLNLFAGGSTSAAVQKAQLARSRLSVERAKLADDIRLELEKYYLDAVNASEAIKVAQGAISQAEENLRITKLKYEEGTGIARDVTDAIALRTLSETNYYRALYDYYRSEAGYLYAMGRNLKDEYGR